MNTTNFVIVNESSCKTLTNDVLEEIATAVEIQLNNDLAPAWGGVYTVDISGPSGYIDPYSCAIWLKDTLPEAPGAAGYHWRLSNGTPVEYIATSDADTWTSTPGALSVTISHECLEVAGDPGANRWCDLSDGKTQQALELCDRCEDTTYSGHGKHGPVLLSNFLLPSAFNPGSRGKYDFCGVLKSQDDLTPGGYAIHRIVSGNSFNVTARMYAGAVGFSFAKQARKKHPLSRTYRRGLVL